MNREQRIEMFRGLRGRRRDLYAGLNNDVMQRFHGKLRIESMDDPSEEKFGNIVNATGDYILGVATKSDVEEVFKANGVKDASNKAREAIDRIEAFIRAGSRR